jgi:hypothetical protein
MCHFFTPALKRLRLLISSTIIEDILGLRKTGMGIVAFFYFDFKDTRKQAAQGALFSILSQLAAQSDVYSNILSELYSAHDSGSKQPSEDSLKECLNKMLELPEQGPIFIVFDALDECPDSTGTPSPRECALDLVEWLVKLRHPHVHVCVTSRPEVDIEAVIETLAPQTVSLHDEGGQMEDIKNYIHFFINSNKCTRKWRKEDKELVIDTLSQRADGM